MAIDVGERDFEQKVVERSREVPVVVDFWAEWCGPCHALSPALEKAADAREGDVELAKVDVDQNQGLAAAFQVQGIPAVKAFKDGRVVDEFTGAIPPPQVEAFFNRIVPSEADRLASGEDEASLRRALELDPRHTEAARRLGRILVERGDHADAEELLRPFEHDFEASGLGARAGLSDRGIAETAFAAWDEGDRERALEELQEALAAASDPEERDLLRRVMVGWFNELGPGDPLAREHRRRLSAALY
jgi:putative thioredoxin